MRSDLLLPDEAPETCEPTGSVLPAPPKPPARPRRGFTLLELMVVVVILGIMLGIVALNMRGKDDQARVAATRTSIRNLENAIDMFKLDTSKYPTTLGDLLTEPSDSKGWNGPYLKKTKALPVDPWGKPFGYRKPGEDNRPYDVFSLGADGSPGGQGFDSDIVGSDD